MKIVIHCPDQEKTNNILKQEAVDFIYSAVYDASKILELLERSGKISGNGHHARQKLAQVAAQEIEVRWT